MKTTIICLTVLLAVSLWGNVHQRHTIDNLAELDPIGAIIIQGAAE